MPNVTPEVSLSSIPLSVFDIFKKSVTGAHLASAIAASGPLDDLEGHMFEAIARSAADCQTIKDVMQKHEANSLTSYSKVTFGDMVAERDATGSWTTPPDKKPLSLFYGQPTAPPTIPPAQIAKTLRAEMAAAIANKAFLDDAKNAGDLTALCGKDIASESGVETAMQAYIIGRYRRALD